MHGEAETVCGEGETVYEETETVYGETKTMRGDAETIRRVRQLLNDGPQRPRLCAEVSYEPPATRRVVAERRGLVAKRRGLVAETLRHVVPLAASRAAGSRSGPDPRGVDSNELGVRDSGCAMSRLKPAPTTDWERVRKLI